MPTEPRSRRKRLDILVVERGLAPSREHAKRLILANKIKAPAIKTSLKPGIEVPWDTVLELTEAEKFVSRGGLKLQAAIDHFDIQTTAKVCADIGASTGGFTDCLLQSGARHVFAVDVGMGQLADKLRNDERVTFIGNLNARNVTSEKFSEPIECVAVDVSFISLARIVQPLYESVAKDCDGIFLIKPQFEAGKEQVSKGRGIIRDPEIHRTILVEVLRVMSEAGWVVKGVIPSPIFGISGNREFICHAVKQQNSSGGIVVANIPVDHLFQKTQ